LTQATDELWRLACEVGGFEARIDALRQSGYVFTQSIANGARNLRDRWPDTEGAFDRELRQVRYEVERSHDRVDAAIRYAESGSDEGRIQSAQTEVQSAARLVSEAQQRLVRIHESDARLDPLELSVQQLNAASFKPDSGEALIVAAPAEWTETTGDRRNLTTRENRRVRMAVQMARLSAIKTLAGFDFAFQPSLTQGSRTSPACRDLGRGGSQLPSCRTR
jgi:hypothetical protein